MNSQEALLPCPFCGGDPVKIHHEPHDHPILKRMGIDWPDHHGSFTVECPKCGVGMIHESEQPLVQAWNRRASPESTQPVAWPGPMNAGHIGDFIDEFADRFGVERFAAAMLAKLAKKRAEGRGGWNRPDECSIDELVAMMADHLKKGDMVDIANFAMMIWNRKHPTAHPAPSTAPDAAEVREPVAMLLYCPRCQMQHIDAADTEEEYARKLHESAWREFGGEKPARWTNPPHATHTCKGCGLNWRPSNVPTVGVAVIPVAELGSEAKHIERMEATNPALYAALSAKSEGDGHGR